MDSWEITDKLNSLREAVDNQADYMNDIVDRTTERRRILESIEEQAENARDSLQNSLAVLEGINDELDEARKVSDLADDEGVAP